LGGTTGFLGSRSVEIEKVSMFNTKEDILKNVLRWVCVFFKENLWHDVTR